MRETNTHRAYRMFTEVMQSVDDQGENVDRQPALEAIDAIIYAMFSESETRALIGAITRSVITGEIAMGGDRQEFEVTFRYLEENM